MSKWMALHRSNVRIYIYIINREETRPGSKLGWRAYTVHYVQRVPGKAARESRKHVEIYHPS